jgi:hypothetical protein
LRIHHGAASNFLANAPKVLRGTWLRQAPTPQNESEPPPTGQVQAFKRADRSLTDIDLLQNGVLARCLAVKFAELVFFFFGVLRTALSG